MNDQQRVESPWYEDLLLAFGFLTILPVPQVPFRPGGLGRAGHWFPLVGLGIGLLLCGGNWMGSQLFPPLLVAALTTALWVLLTGGLHLDGLADCCDGLLAAVPPARRLAIMHDPRTGAFAVIGLILVLSIKITALAAVTPNWPALLFAPTWARWLLLVAACQPTVAGSQLGSEFSNHLSRRSVLLALVIPLLLLSFLSQWRLLLGAMIGVVVTMGIIRNAQNRLGGMTGDVYGLVVEVGELMLLLTMAARFQ